VCRFGRLLMFKSNCEGHRGRLSVDETAGRVVSATYVRSSSLCSLLSAPLVKLASFTSKARHALAAALSSPHPHPHYACAPTASPSGVLKHRDDPFAVPLPRSLRPRALTGVLTLTTRVQAVPLVRVYHCEDRAAGVWRRPSNRRAPLGRPNCTHARDSASCSLSCLGMCAAN